MLRHLSTLLVASFVLIACPSNRVGVPGIDREFIPEEPELASAQVETFADSLTVVAGNQARVRCIVSRDREHLETVPIGVDADAAVGEISLEGYAATFTLSEVGFYKFNCFVPDTDIRDEVGLTIEVVSGAPRRVDTVLDENLVSAGTLVDGMCRLYDEFENPVDFEDLGNSALSPTIVADESLIISQSNLAFSIKGTTAGEYSIACNYDGLSDETPALLEVVPGAPARTDTFVAPAEVSATEEVTVTCVVSDGYGNELVGYTTDYQVMAANGSQASESGLVLNPAQFTAAQAGEYYVFCLVPGFPVGDETPAVATVSAGLPFHWEADLIQQSCYLQDVPFPISYDVVDRWGNPVSDPAVDVSIVPNEGFTVASNGTIIFSEEGDYDITLSLGGEIDSQGSAAPVAFNVRVDSTPPRFQFDSHARGATLQEGAIADVLVDISGRVIDGLSPIVEAGVAGQFLDVGGDSLNEPFGVETNSRWGMTVLSAYAEDECGNRKNAAQSFLRSATYLEPALEVNANGQAQTGVLVHLNQMALDDGYRVDADDVATLMQRVLATIDLSEIVPKVLLGTVPLETISYDCGDAGTRANEVTGFWMKRPSDIAACSDKGAGDSCDFSIAGREFSGKCSLEGEGLECVSSVIIGGEVYDVAACSDKSVGDSCDFTSAGRPYVGSCTGVGASGVTCRGAVQPQIKSLKAVDGALMLEAELRDLVFPLQIHANLDLECSGAVTETITGEIRIGDISLNGRAYSSFDPSSDNPLGISFCDESCLGPEPGDDCDAPCLEMNVQDVVVDFDLENLSFMGDAFEELANDFIVVLEQPLETFFGTFGSTELSPVVSTFLNGIQVGESFDLPQPLSMELNFVTGLDYFGFAGPEGAGFAELGFFTQVYPSSRGEGIPADTRGPIYRALDLPGDLPPFSPAFAFGVGLSDNTLNQVLWALWYSGALSIEDLSGMQFDADMSGIEFSFDATMPPVLMPGRNGNEVEFGLGDARIRASVDLGAALGVSTTSSAEAIEVEMYLSTIVGAEVNRAAEGNAIDLKFDEYPEVWIEVTQINYSGYQAEMTDLFTSLMRLMVPQLLGGALESIPLPEIDVSTLVGLGDGEELWALEGESVSRVDNFYRMTGALR